MSELEWYPADWVDEACPPSKSVPEAFIIVSAKGYELGYAAGDKGIDDADRQIINQPLAVGDVVQFISCDRLPDVEATIFRNGNYRLHGTIPDGHNRVLIDGNSDTLHASFDDLAQELAKPNHDWLSLLELVLPEGAESERVTLNFARWSDREPYLFEIVNGKPVFRPVPAQKN